MLDAIDAIDATHDEVFPSTVVWIAMVPIQIFVNLQVWRPSEVMLV